MKKNGLVHEFAPGTRFADVLLHVRRAELRPPGTKRPKLSLTLGNASGEHPAVLWEADDDLCAELASGAVRFVRVLGTVQAGKFDRVPKEKHCSHCPYVLLCGA